MPKRNLVIVGDSSFAEVACEMFEATDDHKVVAFAVHRQFQNRSTLLERPVHAVEDICALCPPDTADVFVAISYRELNRVRTRVCAEMKGYGYRLATYLSPAAFIWKNVNIGENCFIFENNVIQPFVELGDNVILWSGNHIGHHSILEDNVFLASHVVISGHVTIGRNTFIGVNATIADTVIVGSDNWIGPNALITKDTEAGAMFRVESTVRSPVGSRRFFRVKN